MKPALPRFVGRQHTGRTLALHVLLECGRRDAFIQEILDNLLTRHPLAPADRRLATQLAYGVIRRRGTLDALLRPLVARQPHQVEAWLWEILRLGVYQLALLTHIPPHAALNETVELAALHGRVNAKGFLNGVLRAAAALMTDERTSAPAPDALPLEDGVYRRLQRPVLPAPTTYPVEYLSSAFALPSWLAMRWRKRYSWDECLRLGFWFAGPAPLWLRVNPLRTTRETCLGAFGNAGVEAEAGAHPQSIRLKEHAAIRELPHYQDGWFTVQDESAMHIAAALSPSPGAHVLDLCAAPGGKTTHLAELMHNEGRILACDVDERRLQTVTSLCQRLGVTIVEARRLDAERNEEPPAGPFDAVLVDAPCSNTGVLGRRPEVRWRLKPSELRHLTILQTRLLRWAGERVRPGGAIVYSTCSLEPEENRQVVDAVVQGMPNLALEAEGEHVPGRPADGGYWARLRRR